MKGKSVTSPKVATPISAPTTTKPSDPLPAKHIKFEETKSKAGQTSLQLPSKFSQSIPFEEATGSLPDIKNAKFQSSFKRKENQLHLTSSASIDRLGTAATSKGLMTMTGQSFRPCS